MTIEEFAEKYKLHTRLDECGDKIIPGKRGMLYLDEDKVCLMALDRKSALRSTWETLGGKLWLGDKSLNPKGQLIQDVKIEGITNVKAAIRMVGVRVIRPISDAERARLELINPLSQRHLLRLKSIAGGGVVPGDHPGPDGANGGG